MWDGLPEIEDALMVCAMEAWGISPYACSSEVPISEPADAVLSLVDRSWIGEATLGRTAEWGRRMRSAHDHTAGLRWNLPAAASAPGATTAWPLRW